MTHINISFPLARLGRAFGWAFILILMQTSTTDCLAQYKGYYTQYYTDKALMAKAESWMKAGEWRNGFTKGNANWSVNPTNFYLQYQKHPELWKALFQWLQNTDLNSIPKGKHPIEGTPLIASVEDSKNEALANRKSESHGHVIDFMIVVKGTEGFLRLDHFTSHQNTEYKPDVVRYAYDPDKAQRINCSAGEFVIFFPSDWHVAKVETSLPDQDIRVIVVKMPVD